MRIRILVILLSAVTVVACKETGSRYVSFDGFALGTAFHITVNASDTTGLRGAVAGLFQEVENSMSIYRSGSLLSRLNRNETDSVDAYIVHCITLANSLSEISGGLYDVTVKPLTEVWGFAEKGALEDPDISYILEYVGYDKIRIEDGRLIKSDPRVEIDLNSIAKGYAADLVANLLDDKGIKDYIVEIGGEIFCKGVNGKGTEWVIGIDKPIEDDFASGDDIEAKIRISGKGLATSGNYRRHRTDSHGNKVVHTINPVTGQSGPGDLLSATVVADSCALADGLATMLMASGLEKSREMLGNRPEIMAYLIYRNPDGTTGTYCSPRLNPFITIPINVR